MCSVDISPWLFHNINIYIYFIKASFILPSQGLPSKHNKSVTTLSIKQGVDIFWKLNYKKWVPMSRWLGLSLLMNRSYVMERKQLISLNYCFIAYCTLHLVINSSCFPHWFFPTISPFDVLVFLAGINASRFEVRSWVPLENAVMTRLMSRNINLSQTTEFTKTGWFQ